MRIAYTRLTQQCRFCREENAVPNVLLITADQLRYDALGCAGNSFIQTPNLDSLAASGVNFTNCYSIDPVCVPARATITTGNYPHRCTGVKWNGGRIRDGQNKIAEVFTNAGYETYALGKLHYLPYSAPGEPKLVHGFQHAELTESGRILAKFDPRNKLRGVEEYADYLSDAGWGGFTRAHGIGNNDMHPAPSPLPEEHFVDSWVASRSLHYLREHVEKRKGRPFLMWTSFPKPHSPYDPPRPYDALYDPRQIPKPYGNFEMLKDRDPGMRITAVTHGMEFLSPEAIQVARAHYFALVTFQDKMIGRLLQFLDETGLRDDTIIIYTSDHGDMIGDFGTCFKGNFMEGSVHVPFIVSAPGQIPAGRTCPELVGLQDIMPTLRTLTGVEMKHEMDGADLSGTMNGKGGVRDVIFSQYLDDPSQKYMAFDGRWKYIYCQSNAVEELYDLENDPHELRNLISEGVEAGQAQRLQKEIIRFCSENSDHAMLDGNRLRRSELDVDAHCHFLPGTMGWRWY
jgi:choline-sulfatase